MIALFRGECDSLLHMMLKAMDDLDGVVLSRAARNMKNAVGNFAARRVYDAALQLEHAAAEGDLQAAQEHYAHLRLKVSELIPQLDAILEDFGQPTAKPSPSGNQSSIE
jgi:hypothetical protein